MKNFFTTTNMNEAIHVAFSWHEHLKDARITMKAYYDTDFKRKVYRVDVTY